MLASAVNRSLTVTASADLRTVTESLSKWPKQDFLEVPLLQHLLIEDMSTLTLYLHTPSLRSLSLVHLGRVVDPGFEELQKPNRVIFDFLSNVNPSTLELATSGDHSCRLHLTGGATNDQDGISDNLSLRLSGYSLWRQTVATEAFQSFLHALPPIALHATSFPEFYGFSLANPEGRWTDVFQGFPVVSIALTLADPKKHLHSAVPCTIWLQLREIRISDAKPLAGYPATTWASCLMLERRVEAARVGLVSHWAVFVKQAGGGAGSSAWIRDYASEGDTTAY